MRTPFLRATTARLRLLMPVLLVLVTLVGCSSRGDQPIPPPAASAGFSGEYTHEFFRSTDGIKIFGQMWKPAWPPKAVVVFLHGSIVHGGFYRDQLEEISRHGYAVYAMDMRGYGRSDGTGPRTHIDSQYDSVNDLALVVEKMREKFPGKKIFLAGESMGGAVILLASISGLVDSDGLVLSSPAVRASPTFFYIGVPGFLQSPMEMAAITLGAFSPKTPLLPLFLPGMVIKDDQILEQYKNDPLSAHGFTTVSYASEITKAMDDINRNAPALETPYIIVHGDKDPLVPHRFVKRFHGYTTSEDKTLKIYKGIGHTGMLDAKRKHIIKVLIDWMDERAGQPATAQPALSQDNQVESSSPDNQAAAPEPEAETQAETGSEAGEETPPAEENEAPADTDQPEQDTTPEDSQAETAA